MRSVLLLTAAGLFAVSCTAAYFAVPRAVTPPGVWPDRDTVECGEVGQGETIRQAIRFRNTHPVAVKVSDVSHTCNCASVTVTETDIPPGGETVLNVEWRTGSRRGRTSEDIGILCLVGTGKFELSTVKLTATVLPDVVYEPSNVQFKRGVPAIATIRLRSGRTSSLTLKGVSTNQAAFTATLDAERNEVTVRYDPVVEGADGNGVAVVVATNCPNEPGVVVPITVR